jgi:hypothetical protein
LSWWSYVRRKAASRSEGDKSGDGRKERFFIAKGGGENMVSLQGSLTSPFRLFDTSRVKTQMTEWLKAVASERVKTLLSELQSF